MKIGEVEIRRDGSYGCTVIIKKDGEQWELDFYAAMSGYDGCKLVVDWEKIKKNGDKEWGEL